jgi:hypothetical protein
MLQAIGGPVPPDTDHVCFPENGLAITSVSIYVFRVSFLYLDLLWNLCYGILSFYIGVLLFNCMCDIFIWILHAQIPFRVLLER